MSLLLSSFQIVRLVTMEILILWLRNKEYNSKNNDALLYLGFDIIFNLLNYPFLFSKPQAQFISISLKWQCLSVPLGQVCV